MLTVMWRPDSLGIRKGETTVQANGAPAEDCQGSDKDGSEDGGSKRDFSQIRKDSGLI